MTHQICKLVDSKDTGRSYEIEYTIEKLPGQKRHLFSSVSLGSNERYVCVGRYACPCFLIPCTSSWTITVQVHATVITLSDPTLCDLAFDVAMQIQPLVHLDGSVS